jgi:two-component system alkaline phosphatase synthesis response regulator PhoP
MHDPKKIYRVAIIEDEPAICEMYKFKLEKTGFEVKTAIDGVEGFELVDSYRPDLVLLDLKMPRMTGDEMLEKIRSKSWGSDVRVIILTNISKDEAPKKLSLLNVDRYVVKAHYTPFQVVQIVLDVLDGTYSSNEAI